MKILAADHSALLPASRKLYDGLAAMPDMELRLMVPDRWFDNYRMVHHASGSFPGGYVVIADHVILPTRVHRMIYRGLAKELDAFRPDILFMNGEPENYQTAHAAWALKSHSPKTKLIFTSWRNIDHRLVGFPYKLSFLNAIAEHRVLRAAAHGIVYNRDAQRILAELGFPHTTVIPPFADTSIFREAAGGRTPGDSFRIGFLGRLIPLKGIDLLMKAVKDLPFPYRLVIIGQGPAKEELSRLAQALDIGSHTEWFPGIPHETIPTQLRNLDVVVLPSLTGTHWKEQFGRILIESMACGVPVIGSDSGEIPEVIGDAGFIFPEGNIDALRGHIISLHGDIAARQAFTERGKARVERLFSVKSAVERHYGVFQDVLMDK